MENNNSKTPNFFYLVSLQINLLVGKQSHSMRGLATMKPITYTDIEAAAKKDHGENVDTVILLYKESMSLEAYKNFWSMNEEEKKEEEAVEVEK